jgi:hypothetical protein
VSDGIELRRVLTTNARGQRERQRVGTEQAHQDEARLDHQWRQPVELAARRVHTCASHLSLNGLLASRLCAACPRPDFITPLGIVNALTLVARQVAYRLNL